jgi:aromatic-L-amino-acid decarboxylase
VKTLKDRISELEIQSSVLEPTEIQRNGYIEQIREFTNHFLNGLKDSKAYSEESPHTDSLKISGKVDSLSNLIRKFDSEVVVPGINCASGGHFGYIPGGGLFVSSLADYLAAVTNEYSGLYYASPGGVVIENEVLRWMKSLFGFPENSAATLTSGGSIANLIALTAARDDHKIKNGEIRRSVVYLSSHTHHCIHKALKIIGLEDVILRYSKLDNYLRINTKELENQIISDKEAGLNPFLIIATAGTTDTGAVDPLAEIGRIALAKGLWYHIDAAYGGFFILTSQKRELLNGLSMADSLVTDPHKGMFIPYGTGAVIVKKRSAVTHSHMYAANYMQDSRNYFQDIDNPADVSPELTRHFRGLRIWLPLQIYGLKPFIKCLEEKILLIEYFREKLAESGFRTGPTPDLTVSYFWYPSKNVDEDTYNRKFLELLHKDGRVFFSSTTIDGKFVIRIAILSFRTKLSHVNKALDLIKEIRFNLEKEYNYK